MTHRTGRCHCGTVQFEVSLVDGFSTIRRCTCSYCRMRGAVVASAEMADIRIVQGEEALTRYRFNTGTAAHFFCSRCGIYTHHQRRSNPHLYGVNVACLDGVEPVRLRAGAGRRWGQPPERHGQATRIAGTLRFVPAVREDEPR